MIDAELIDLLRRTAPGWFSLTEVSSEAMQGHAVVAVVNGVGKTVADLRITANLGKVTVSETVVGTAFPARCSERHIEWDGAFCIGYRAGLAIHTVDQAIVWWGLLEQFLRLQRIASRTRRWPVRQAIAHGEAGPHHLRALAAAGELGLEEDYYQMLEGESKWFGGRFPKLSTDSQRLLNGRLRCPKGCTRRGKPILRRDCSKSEIIYRLIQEERLRRKKEQEFWNNERSRAVTCCGTMDNCPLSQLSKS